MKINANNHFSIKRLLIAFTTMAALSSCTKDQLRPQLADGSSIVVTDLPGDTGRTVATGFRTFYFSLTTNAKVDSTQKQTADWDICFAREYNSYLGVNSGTDNASYGIGGPGHGAMVQVNQAYDQVTTAPSDDVFKNNGVSSAGWDPGNGTGWYFYDLNTHIAVPIKNRTFVIRTATGKYAKLELVSMYKGAPAVVTNLYWPAPYFTFRYYVQQDGTRNLATKN